MDTLEQQSYKSKRINDYIENHYHDSNSDDIDMDGNIGVCVCVLICL